MSRTITSAGAVRPAWNGPFEARLKTVVRPLRLFAWLAVAAAYAAVLLSFALRPDFRCPTGLDHFMLWAATMVRTFLFHLGVAALVCGVIAGTLRQWRVALAAAPLACVGLLPEAGNVLPSAPAAPVGETVRVMSVNLLAANRQYDAMLAEIEAAAPDILLLQEYSLQWHAATSQRLHGTFPFAVEMPRRDCFGAAIFSRRPFVGPVQRDLQLGTHGTPDLRAVVRVEGRDVAVYCIHTVPPTPGGVPAQGRQFADLFEILRGEPLPAIVGGDFNATDRSPPAQRLHALGYRDAFLLAGRGRGSTWPDRTLLRWLPGIRIDHLYLSRELTCDAFATGTGPGSDHRPICGRIGFAGAQ